MKKNHESIDEMKLEEGFTQEELDDLEEIPFCTFATIPDDLFLRFDRAAEKMRTKTNSLINLVLLNGIFEIEQEGYTSL